MYVTLARLERGGFVARLDAPAQRSDRKVYCLTPAGHERVTEWMSDVSWPRPDLAEFHMKLIAAAQGTLADPVSIIDAQRRDLLRRAGTSVPSAAFLVENLFLALVAAVIGLLAGWRAAPLVSRPEADLVGALAGRRAARNRGRRGGADQRSGPDRAPETRCRDAPERGARMPCGGLSGSAGDRCRIQGVNAPFGKIEVELHRDVPTCRSPASIRARAG